LQTATNGAVQGVVTKDSARRTHFPEKGKELNEALCGQHYTRKTEDAIVLAGPTLEAMGVGMEVDGAPAFIKSPCGDSAVYIWSTLNVIDVTHPLSAEVEFEERTDQYIPGIISLGWRLETVAGTTLNWGLAS
jgi:hypothetical protein